MSPVPDMCDRVTRWGFVTLIVFTPLAFGTVEPWSIAAMEWGIVTLVLVFWLGRLWPGGEATTGIRAFTGLEAPFGLFLLFCVLQTVPLPMHLLERISPGSARMCHGPATTLPGVADEIGSVGAPVPVASRVPSEFGPVSVSPRETWSRVQLVASFGALFLLTTWWGRRDRIVFLLTTVTVVGFLVSLFGLVQFLTWNGKIYWIRKVQPASSFGPFVNHN